MHISLDSALGQQRRLNSVGESITQIAPDPAAAYSLRSLTGGDPKVVRVRRASDNHEQDFTASEVSSGALVDFVNAQVVAPLDIQALSATGRDGDFLIAKAAYSLRSLGTRQATVAATGDTVARANGKYVCQVRSLTGDLKSFTATEVSDGTLVDFVLGNTVSLVNNRAYFDGSSNYISYSNGSDFSLSSNESFELSFNFVYVESSNLNRRILSVADSSGNSNVFEIYKQPSAASNAIGIMFGGDSTAKVNTGALASGKEYLIKFGYNGSSFFCDLDGTTVQSSTETHSGISTAGNLIVGARHDTNQKASGVISNISFSKSGTTVFSVSGHGTTASNWTSDQSDSPTINGTLAAYTGQEMDGFVKTWYDQSVTTQAGDTATGNHATQATAADQPKIVSAGALNADGGLLFDSSEFDLGSSVSLGSAHSIFAVAKTSTARSSTFPNLLTNPTNGRGVGIYSDAITDKAVAASNTDNSFNFSSNTNRKIMSVTSDATNVNGFENGTASSDNTRSQSLTTNDFKEIGGGSNFAGTIEEIIVYLSDQTDNRTAIEANIGEVYSIDLPSGVDPGFDQVDGFVETWYDQSGNGKDAVQTTAANQPKIVSAGSLVVDSSGVPELEFDGSNDALSAGTGFASSSKTIFCVNNPDSLSSNGLFAFGSSQTDRFFAQYTSNLIRTEINGAQAGVSAATQKNLTTNLHTTDISVGLNGGSFTTTSASFSGVSASAELKIGQRFGTAFVDNFDGTIQEFIVYNSDQTANRTALETNINNHYSIF